MNVPQFARNGGKPNVPGIHSDAVQIVPSSAATAAE